jgi:hypothetical protein
MVRPTVMMGPEGRLHSEGQGSESTGGPQRRAPASDSIPKHEAVMP